jgi:hypothetical protein
MRTDLDPNATNAVAAPDPLVERLRELPDAGPPPYDYSEFSRRYARRRTRHTRLPLRWMAAALAVVVVGWVVQHRLGPMLGEVATTAVPPQATPSPVLLPASDAERWLNAQPRSAIVRVPTQMAVTEVEDQIAAMDDELTAAQLSQPRAQQVAILQRDRAQLVESLAQVRYAQNLMAGLL